MFRQCNAHLDLTAVQSGCTNRFVRFMARLGTQRVEMRALSLTGCVAQLTLSSVFIMWAADVSYFKLSSKPVFVNQWSAHRCGPADCNSDFIRIIFILERLKLNSLCLKINNLHGEEGILEKLLFSRTVNKFTKFYRTRRSLLYSQGRATP